MPAEPLPEAAAEPRFSGDELVAICTSLLVALGTPGSVAELVARSLVLSNLTGHDSHGIVRLLQYADWVQSGQIRPTGEARVVAKRLATAVVDGGWGFGQPAAQLATSLAVELASSAGVAAVTITSCNHIGRVGEYVGTIAATGKMGVACCNTGSLVAPFGGSGRVMGTNPFAWAVPLGDSQVVLDFATSNVAEGKVKIAYGEGRTVPPGSIVDREGRPSVEPADFYDGGSLLAFGAHKGSGMSMLIELSAALLSGMGSSPDPDFGGGNGTLILALDIAAFVPLEEFERGAETFARLAKTIGPGPDDGEILLPGEPEQRHMATRRESGIVVQSSVRQKITTLAEGLGVELGAFALAP